MRIPDLEQFVRARPFLKTRFRAIAGQPDDGDHWSGGEVRHVGATCPTCKIPLLLIWDVNAGDSRFPRKKFGALERVPLYYCWSCVGDLAYRVASPNRVKVYSKRRKDAPTNCQYEPYPTHFDRTPIALDDAIPTAFREAYLAWWKSNDLFGDKLSEKRKAIFADYLGHPFSSSLSVFHSQLGGMPSNRWWGVEAVPCPNPECSADRAMSFLAGVLNDPLHGLPMVEPVAEVTEKWWNFYISVEFQICRRCYTISGRNRCD